MSITISEKVSKEAKKDILELQTKIDQFNSGQIEEDKFKHFRLTRGVYGQRQIGVQMIRIKLPYGKVTTDQLVKIADVSDKYATGNLHLTTRQDIQLHYVKLEDSPKVWAELEHEAVTLREACGNTVRNVTASAVAGIDPDEAFDVTPYAHAFTHYFLRNPICQDMGRKFKAAFSSSEKDTAFTFLHDIGFIPRIKDGKRGFKVVVGGGLGAQAIVAQTVSEFMPTDEFIPFTEAILRVFDRYGERSKRFKARMKFLVQKLGLEEFLKLIEKEQVSLKNQTFPVKEAVLEASPQDKSKTYPIVESLNEDAYNTWKTTNVFEQKQQGLFGVNIRVLLGDIHSSTARKLAAIVKANAANDIRVTMNQGLLLRGVRPEALPVLYNELAQLGLSKPGFDSIHDITACPGSDTCNLAVTDSTNFTKALEDVLQQDYPNLIYESNIKIKISGCMNSCGQHMAAQIGFHGSSIKNGALIAPAMQVVLGGGVTPEGEGLVAEKVIKLPSKKAPLALKFILNDYEENAIDGEYFNAYFQRLGKMHFYHLLKPLADVNQLEVDDYVDWGKADNFKPEIGVGECAGITLDVIGTVINEAQEKIDLATEGFREKAYADAIYNAYSGMVIAAKALLLSENHQCNTQIGIIKDFDEKFVGEGKVLLSKSFEEMVLAINKNEPSEDFATKYINDATAFVELVKAARKAQVEKTPEAENQLVIDRYYKA